MTAVLVDAQKPGLSGWIFVRGSQRVRVSGLNGAKIKLLFIDGKGSFLDVETDGEYKIPEECDRMNARVLEVTEQTRIFIDLVN